MIWCKNHTLCSIIKKQRNNSWKIVFFFMGLPWGITNCLPVDVDVLAITLINTSCCLMFTNYHSLNDQRRKQCHNVTPTWTQVFFCWVVLQLPQQTWDVGPTLVNCWANVVDGRPTVNQRWAVCSYIILATIDDNSRYYKYHVLIVLISKLIIYRILSSE